MPQVSVERGSCAVYVAIGQYATRNGSDTRLFRNAGGGDAHDRCDCAVKNIVAEGAGEHRQPGEDRYCMHWGKNKYVAKCEEGGKLLQHQELWSMVQSGM